MTCLFMSLPEDDEAVQADNHSGSFSKELCHLVSLRKLAEAAAFRGISDYFYCLLIFIHYLECAYCGVCVALAALRVLDHQITFTALTLRHES